MSIPNLPQILPNVPGYGADKTTIPDLDIESSGIPSVQKLFPPITALNPTAGGKMIQRSWMNGILNLFGQHLFWLQTYKPFPWQSTIDYPVGAHCVINQSGSVTDEYVCIQQNGPNITGHTNKSPVGADGASYWKKSNSVPVGSAGSSVNPIYLSNGSFVASNASVGSSIKPIYISNGTLTASNSTVGSASQPIFMSGGNFYQSTSTIGSGSKPVYLSSGSITQCGNNLDVNISGSSSYAGTAANYTGDGGIASALNSKLDASQRVYLPPIGSVIWGGWSTAPSGYLVCDGSIRSVDSYPALYAAIGTNFGGSGGMFNLPNLIGKFAEGSTNVGTYKSAGIPNVTGSLAMARTGRGWNPEQPAGSALTYGATWNASISEGADDNWGSFINLNASICSNVYNSSTTVQPEAVTLMPCIRYE